MKRPEKRVKGSPIQDDLIIDRVRRSDPKHAWP